MVLPTTLKAASLKARVVAKRLAVLFACGLLSACAYLGAGTEKPEVYLTGLRPLGSSGFEARFMVGLKIVNMDSRALNVSGMSYRLKLNGHSVASGVSAGVGKIPGYSEKRVEVEASTNLLTSFRVLADILKNPAQPYAYELETKLRKPWWPTSITVVESGDISLGE
ncbi:MAG: LEA type 2 family protein [Porticoccaceae bacterium]